VEAVFIPEVNRGTLCVSSQAGCVLDCAFCSTGKQGFNRNLSSAEIIGQLWLANRLLEGERPVSNVVMMGMGEPLLNLDNVIPALRLMLDDNAYGLSRRRHRCRLRPARGRGRRPHAPARNLSPEGSAGMKRIAALAIFVLLAACATKEPESQGGTIVGEVGDARNRARVHTDLAGAYYERGNMGVALDELRLATTADPSYPQAYELLGLVYMELKDARQAESNFERALRLSPNDANINHNYGWFLCQNRREKDSIRYFLQALRNPLYASPARTYSTAGLCSAR